MHQRKVNDDYTHLFVQISIFSNKSSSRKGILRIMSVHLFIVESATLGRLCAENRLGVLRVESLSPILNCSLAEGGWLSSWNRRTKLVLCSTFVQDFLIVENRKKLCLCPR